MGMRKISSDALIRAAYARPGAVALVVAAAPTATGTEVPGVRAGLAPGGRSAAWFATDAVRALPRGN